MLWARHLIVLLALATLPAACGFEPVYAHHDEMLDPQLAAISVDQVSDRLGVILTNHLRDGFDPLGAAPPKRWLLHVALDEQTGGLAYRSDGTVSQTAITINAQWTLKNLTSGKIVASGSALGSDAYDEMNDSYANVSAKRDGEVRAVEQLADNLHMRIVLAVKNLPDAS